MSLPQGWTSVEGLRTTSLPAPASAVAVPLTRAILPSRTRARANPVLSLLCPPPPVTASPLKLRAIAAARALFMLSPPPPNTPRSRLPRRVTRVNYRSQLEFRPSVTQWVPTVTPPKPPRAQLNDPTAGRDTLYTASSRLGHGLIGVFAKCKLPFSVHDTPRRLCEFRSEQGNICDDVAKHAHYITCASSTKTLLFVVTASLMDVATFTPTVHISRRIYGRPTTTVPTPSWTDRYG